MEKLAAAVMAQLARRDIWVTDVEIVELSKKKIGFRETEGGIVIKNKKFLFDESSSIVCQEMTEAPAQPQAPPPVALQPHEYNMPAPQSVATQPHNQGQLRPIDWVVFSPELPDMVDVKKKNLRFTPDKKYPVFEKKMAPNGIGEVFLTRDDLGREQLISDKYFVPGQINLFADKELRFSENPNQSGGKLLWSGDSNVYDVPALR